jgi:PST family polysaccharide transporter
LSERRVSARRQVGILALAQPATQVVGIVVAFVLARQLFPRDYGMVAMATGFTGVLAMVSGLGLSDAALQRKELTQAESSALFWLNSTGGLFFGVGAAMLGPALGRYFHESAVPYVAAWAGAAIFLNSLGGQHRIQVMRRGAYGTAVLVDLVTQFVAGSTAIGAALAGLGWKSLVVLLVAQATVRSTGMWLVARWVPDRFRWDSVPRDTVRLGLVVCFGWVLYSLSATAESAVLGRVSGAEGLGLYTKAMQIARYPVMILFVPAFLPAVHRLGQRQEDSEAMAHEFLRMFSLVMLPMSLILGLLAGSARQFIPLVMGNQWDPTVPLLLVILVGIFGVPLTQAAMWGLTASAQRRRMMQFQFVNAVVPVAFVTCGALLAGAWGTSVAFSIGTWAILVPVGVYFSVRFVGVDLGQLLSGVATIAGLVVTTALSTWFGGWAANQFLRPGLFIHVIGGVAGGGIVWFFAARRVRQGSFRELVETLASGAAIEDKPWTRRFVDWCAPPAS